ncbi:MAG TPA: hypothetical protein VF546_13640 [Pyrinomonadaceae bacterium]|jgi:hypothetical protein
MRHRPPPLLLILLILLACARASADEFTDRTIYPVETRDGLSFNIEPSYDRATALVGRVVNLKIRITLPPSSAPKNFLRLVSLMIDSPDAPAASEFAFKNLNPNEPVPRRDEDSGALGVEYKYQIAIPQKADAREYLVNMDFAYEDEKTQSRSFTLAVGKQTNDDKVKPAEVGNSQPNPYETGFFKSQEVPYRLTLKNNYSNYTVYVDELSVDSDPPGLIQPKKMEFPDNPVKILPGHQNEFPLTFYVEPLTVRNMVKGLAAEPKLIFRAKYHDDNQHPQIDDFYARAPLSIVPSTKVLLGAILVGLVLGVAVRFVLEFMVLQKQLTRGALARFLTYTMLFGLLVALLAFIGKIEVKGFTVSGSYDNPLAMMFVGLVAALAGLQLFVGWYKAIRGTDNLPDGGAKE